MAARMRGMIERVALISQVLLYSLCFTLLLDPEVLSIQNVRLSDVRNRDRNPKCQRIRCLPSFFLVSSSRLLTRL